MKLPVQPRWRLGRARRHLIAGVLIGALVGLGAGWLLVRQPSLSGPPSVPDAHAGRALLRENAQLRQLQAIDRQAQISLRETVAVLTARNAELKKRLGLLRGVLLPDGRAGEVGIADLTLTRQADGVRFGYSLLLARGAHPAMKTKLTGRVELWLLGGSPDEPVSQRVADLPLVAQQLQTLTGAFKVPGGYQPQGLRVVIAPTGQLPLATEFGWQELLANNDPL